MNNECWDALDKELLEGIKKMESSGSNVKDVLQYLATNEVNDKLLKFYLEALYGERLSGSIYTSRWSRETESTKDEILVILEQEAIDARARSDLSEKDQF